MSDEAHSLRTIDWKTVFPFTQLFRAFRIAIHPAKIALALIAILLVYSVGRSMDGIWLDRHLAVPGEVEKYESSTSREGFSKSVDLSRKQLEAERKVIATGLSAEWTHLDKAHPPLPPEPSYHELKRVIDAERDEEVKLARDTYDKVSEKNKEAADHRDDSIRAAYSHAGSKLQALNSVSGHGLCLTFVEYEANQIDAIAAGVITFDWTGPRGVLSSIHRFVFTGPGWALSKHPLFFILFTAFALLVWSIFGGAIARIAAVHVSQDEKISVRQALRFSTNKLMSFFAAPIMPLLLIGIIALVLAILGWLSEIAYVGGLLTIVIGIAFVILIFVGVLVACALLGWVCGFGLMYPTIAVEGSDAFDAVSRSFSYVFARPWKVFVYSIISLIYGAVTYLFLRFMVFLTLSVLHESLTFWTRSTGPTGSTSIANAWTGPQGPFDLASGPTDPFSLTFAESVGSSVLLFWVSLFVALLGAYLLSFFVSINTIMYYLLRHDVDATDIDDVYLEPSDDEFEDALPESATGTVTTRTEAAANVPASAMTERLVEKPLETSPPAESAPPVVPLSDEPTPPPAGS